MSTLAEHMASVDESMRRRHGDIEHTMRNCMAISWMEAGFRTTTTDYLVGYPLTWLTTKAVASLRSCLDGNQATYLAGMIMCCRLLAEQELEEDALREEYRILSGPEAERLLKSVGGA